MDGLEQKTLYISDLDGTLLGNDSRISEFSAKTISELTEKGALITVATARTPATVQVLMQQTLTAPPAIVMTGAAMWSRTELRFIEPKFMSGETAAKIKSIMELENVNPFIYCLDADSKHLSVYHPMAMNHKEQAFYDERRNLKLKTFHLGDMPDGDEWNRVMLIFTTGDADAISRAAKKVDSACECSMSVYPDIFDPKSAIIEIFASGVSKSNAALRLKEMTGTTRIVAFGDNLNDLPMFEIADMSVAVDNAQPEVKQAAHNVIGCNSENSVAKFIKKDFEQ